MAAQRADELIFTQVLPVGTSEEHALAQAFKRGESDAYAAIHERYAPRVHGVCRRMLHNPDDAAEAAQEAFLRIYQGLTQFNGRYRLGAWVVRVTTNVCLDQLRARSRRPSDPTPMELLELESAPPEGNDPEILFMRHAEGRKVRKILDSLPPLHRAAIVLRDFEGISYAEIADTLGLTECQVKALLHRARRGFRKNWSTNFASIFAPFVAFKRFFRPVKTDATQHLSSAPQAAESAVTTAQQMSTAAGQAFQTCSGVIQGCGQFLADRAAPVVTAVVVGTATVGVAAIREREPRAEVPVVQREAAPIVDARTDERERRVPVREPKVKAKVLAAPPAAPTMEQPVEVVVVPVTPEEPPAEEEQPQAPAEGEQPVADTVEEVTPNTEPPLPPLSDEPQDYNLSFNIDLAGPPPCTCLSDPSTESSEVGISDQGLGSFDHVVAGSAVAAGVPTYGLHVRHSSKTGSDHEMEFSLWTEEGAYMYSAIGTLAEKAKTDWGGWVYRYTGTYDLFSMPTSNETVPQSGGYVAEVFVSWRQARIVASNFTLTN
jgi:RNA polymerase sigma-70 factor (ECF subfamily)